MQSNSDMEVRQVAVSVADILARPSGSRTRQLLYGEQIEVGAYEGDHVEVSALRDGYTGYMRLSDLGQVSIATHRVINLATHLYKEPDLKSPDLVSLSFGSLLTVVEQGESFCRTREGAYVPAMHLAPVQMLFNDPVAVAELFLGTPYLWGGNSRLGIDCSGLVQLSCLACGIPCAGDAITQEKMLGEKVAPDEPLARGDVLFWKGHTALASGPDTLLHSNAGFMTTMFEPAEDAVVRIERSGGGPVTSRRRLPKLT